MSILTFFKPTNTLPTAKNTGLSEHVTREANKAVENALQEKEAPPTAVMKELCAQWLTALYDNLRGRPEVISNGFKEAGIMAALENQADADSDEDPFANLD